MELTRSAANPAFRYVVEIDGVNHAVFTECTLPAVEWEVQEVKEGGLNTHTHQLPGRRKGTKLTLKNGLGTDDLLQWCVDSMNETFTRRSISVTLYNVAHEPLIRWDIADALPSKWTAPQLKSDSNAIAIQSLEFVCGNVTVERA